MTNKTHFASFNRFEIELPEDCVMDCSAQGRVDDSVDYWQRQLVEELSKIGRDKLIAELKEYGAWTLKELNELDDNELEQKILWIAACNIKDELNEEN
jgi:hypothetical protein